MIMTIDPKKVYAVRIFMVEIEVFRIFDRMEDAERLWKNPKYSQMKGFATVTGVCLQQLSEKRKLIEKFD